MKYSNYNSNETWTPGIIKNPTHRIQIGRGAYPFVCCVCGHPGIGAVPVTKTHPECQEERKRREQEKAREKRLKAKAKKTHK